MTLYHKFILGVIVIFVFFSIPFSVWSLACNQDSDCPSGQVCQANVCVIETEITISVTVREAVSPPPGGGGILVPPSAMVVFEGKAYPKSFVTVLKNGRIAGTTQADSFANFQITLTGVPAGVWNFSLFTEDIKGRKSLTLNFSASLIAGTTTTFSGIFLSPTIELSSDRINKGEALKIFGYSAPKSEVNIFISSLGGEEIVKKTKARTNGKWLYYFDTFEMNEGGYRVKVKSVLEGEISPFSQSLEFVILSLRCMRADLNFDGKVNLVDFSILLYFWHQTSPENICADINQDGIVNLVDFSIMMYYWTG